MRVVIPGGTGQVGTVLARAFHAAGHQVVVLSRRPAAAPWRVVEWDGQRAGSWTSELEGADAVINLAGHSVNCRYTASNREAILSSRVASTRAIGLAMTRAEQPPTAWLQMSTATIYSHRFDAPNDELTGILGGAEPDAQDTWRFSIEVAKAWEEAAAEIPTTHTRKVLLRSAMVMSPDRGGIFDTLLGLVRLGLGGRAGSGRQYISWIHDTDFTRAIFWLLEHKRIAGAVNLAAPGPVPNAEFMRALRQAWGMPIGLPATRWMLAIGAMVMRTETELVLKSRRVVPGRLVAESFDFEFPEWSAAACDLCRRWRATRRGGPASPRE